MDYRHKLQQVGQFWTPILGQFSTPIDNDDYVRNFQDARYRFVSTAAEMKAAGAAADATRMLGLFNTSNVDGALDRRLLKKGGVERFPDQPDLADQVTVAIDLLSKNPNGFVLLVESGRIDKYSHSMDPERAIFDTIMLDEAVKVAKEFAGRNNDTLIIVTPDHAHPVSIIGTYDDDAPGQTPREKNWASTKRPSSRSIRIRTAVPIPARSTYRSGSL